MYSANPFPESKEKEYLRLKHFTFFTECKRNLGRDLSYFGLPSAEMLDIKLWKNVLCNIVAVEREEKIALMMYRTATIIGVRPKTIILENDLLEITKLLVLDDKYTKQLQLSSSEQEKIQKARSIKYDIINLDLCGGFLYPKSDGHSDNAEIMSNLINYQAKHKHPFTLIITFNLRDTGIEHYNAFIEETLHVLNKLNIDTSELRDYYLSPEVDNQPPNLRRLRFCVPTYLHKIAFNNYQVKSLGAWYYKTFYHTALYFEPRKGVSILSNVWPPIDEFKELMKNTMIRVDENMNRELEFYELSAPYIE